MDAKQEGFRAQQKIIAEILKDCSKKGMSSAEATEIVREALRTVAVENLADTQVSTYFAGGATSGVNVAIPAGGNGRKEYKGNKPNKGGK
jgi:uncharacterized protein YoaH (UPF0181 family)